MLQVEDQLNEYDGVLLADYNRSTSYQLTGALKRLGRKIIGLNTSLVLESELNKESEKMGFKVVSLKDLYTPSPNLSFKTFVYFFNQTLSKNESLEEEEVQEFLDICQTVRKINEDVKTILVLPHAVKTELLTKIQRSQTAKNLHIILSPAVYGFRDNGLFDFLMHDYHESKFLDFAEDLDVSLIWSADLASFVVSVILKQVTGVRIYSIKTPKIRLLEFQKAFQDEFRTLLDKNMNLKTLLKNLLQKRKRISLSIGNMFQKDFGSEKDNDFFNFFPDTLTNYRKALEKTHLHYKTNRDLELHFLPGRAL